MRLLQFTGLIGGMVEVFLPLVFLSSMSHGFVTRSLFQPRRKACWTFSQRHRHESLVLGASPEETGEIGSGPNWIERSFPVDIKGEAANAKKVEDYDLGISGVAFQTGALSRRMFDAIVSTNQSKMDMSDEVRLAFKLYAMDFTAKEATKAALKQNGLEMVLEQDMEDEGLWGDVDSIQLLDDEENPLGPIYDTTDDAIKDWTPGQGFNFVVRQVPAKLRELSLGELLQALDPDGKLRAEAKEKGMSLPDEEIETLQQLAYDSMRRCHYMPGVDKDSDGPFGGIENKRGYRVISMSDLLPTSIKADGAENQKTLMHVMDSLVSHGALIVDITDGGVNMNCSRAMTEMWNVTENFFSALDYDASQLDATQATVTDGVTGFRRTKLGFSSYDDGTTQVVEASFEQNNKSTPQPLLQPKEVQDIIGPDGALKLRTSFDIMADIGRSVVRIATAASTMEANAFAETTLDTDGARQTVSGLSFLSGEEDENGTNEAMLASASATRMVNEIIDDGRPTNSLNLGDGSGLSMSSLRLCRFEYRQDKTEADRKQIFSPRVDSTFATIVPLSTDSGEGVFDEDAERWYRPHVMARKHWEAEQKANNKDSNALFDSLSSSDCGDTLLLPWNARYVIVFPGELLQLTTRNEVPAAVHKVLELNEGASPRFAAPVFLRGRSASRIEVERYFGRTDKAGPLLNACEGLTMDEINEAMQPPSFQ